MFQQKLPKYMTQEEMQIFFFKIKSKRDLSLFGWIYKYGLRVTEASKLNLNDLDLCEEGIVELGSILATEKVVRLSSRRLTLKSKSRSCKMRVNAYY